jgi:tetratricopeptide (TPR) repeat protein
MKVIFHDFEYAVAKKVENSLWQCHIYLNAEYRKTLGRLNTQNQIVQRRKLDKLYRGFLKTAESFYVVYIQNLYKRFSIPELQQFALGAQPQPTETSAEDVSPATPLRALVLKSCQMTLIRLGDLARYRCQLSDKVSKPNFDKALDYYSLANNLDPEDGSAHHQSAVLHQILDQHFEIVYHFHRAISVAKPHELAFNNLEREFKSPEGSVQARKGPVKDHLEAMATWFVRLHAFFFHGKLFSQQSELEEEVLHRVEMALKNEGSNILLLKMILINMAAYDISTEKVKCKLRVNFNGSCLAHTNLEC